MIERMKQSLKNIYYILKKSIEKFPVTIITIIILTIIYAINLNNNFFNGLMISNITSFGIIFSVTTFLIETLDIKNLNKKIISYIVASIISAIFVYAINEIKSDFVIRLIICYCLSISILSIYFNYKKSNKQFENYITNVFINILKSGIVYGILAIGFAIILSIFISLILDNSSYILIFRVEILLFGIYYIPAIVYSFYNVDNEIGKFSKVLIKYVLNSLVIVAFIIIYIYIAKIIIFRTMPSNQIFRILASLFILGCPIWTMASSFKDEDAVNKINKWLPILFIPFIILQIYSIAVRISNNGFTEPRYLCVMLIIFEIIYVIMYLKNKEKIGNTLIAIIVITIISTIVPYVNMFKVSELSQYNNLKLYKQKSSYTAKEKDKIYGAYIYLKENDKIKDLLTKKDIETIRSFSDNSKYDTIEYIYGHSNTDYINIKGYSRLYFIDANSYREEDLNDAFENIEFESKEGIKFKLNLSNEFKNYIYNSDNIAEYIEENNEIYINRYRKIIIESISVEYDKVNELVRNYRISAYLLEE